MVVMGVAVGDVGAVVDVVGSGEGVGDLCVPLGDCLPM